MKSGNETAAGRIVLAVALMCAVVTARAHGFLNLPPLPSPDRYGNILINRTSTKNGVKPASFSHWLHRKKHTCRVCHSELEFNMKAGTTEITEMANKGGKFCGAGGCHDGRAVFGHEKSNCGKCHSGDLGQGGEKFTGLAKLPAAPFGNKVDWVAALDRGMLAPLRYLGKKPEDIAFDKTLSLEAEMNLIPPSVFPHKAHTAWLDCNNCHPDIFNIKKKGTQHFSMARILKGEFCGVCHLSVAFPMNDCQRCHPGMENVM